MRQPHIRRSQPRPEPTYPQQERIPQPRRFSGHNIGVLLTIMAGLAALATNVWPAAVVVGEGVRPSPWLLAIPVGALFLLCALLVNRFPGLVKAVVGIGSLAMLAWGAYAILTWGSSSPAMAWSVVLVPSLLGLAAAALIGPLEQDANP